MRVLGVVRGRARRVHFVGGNGLHISSYEPFLTALGRNSDVSVTTTDLSSLSKLAVAADVLKSDTGVWEAATNLVVCDAQAAARKNRAVHGAGPACLGAEAEADGGVIGIGHSLGGALTLCAAARAAPGTFNKIICIDPPMFHQNKRSAAFLLNKLGVLPKHNPLSNSARRRRQSFRSSEHVRKHFTGRGTFAEWDHACIASFAIGGVERNGDSDNAGDNGGDGDGNGVALKFTPALEAAFFAETPTETDWAPQGAADSLATAHHTPVCIFLNVLEDAGGASRRRPLKNGTRGGWLAGCVSCVYADVRAIAHDDVIVEWNPTTWLGQYNVPPVPGHYIYSTQHRYTSAADIAWLKERLGGMLAFEPVDYGHFFPLEVPATAANYVIDLLFQDSCEN